MTTALPRFAFYGAGLTLAGLAWLALALGGRGEPGLAGAICGRLPWSMACSRRSPLPAAGS